MRRSWWEISRLQVLHRVIRRELVGGRIARFQRDAQRVGLVGDHRASVIPAVPGIAELPGGDFSIGYESAELRTRPDRGFAHPPRLSGLRGEGNVHRLPPERGRRTASTRKSTRFGRLPPQGHAKPGSSIARHRTEVPRPRRIATGALCEDRPRT